MAPLSQIIKQVQTKLGLESDGIAGSDTWTAIANALGVESPSSLVSEGLDPRSERTVATLSPQTQEVARKFLQQLREAGIQAKIISGYRTYAEQEALYEQGRSKPGQIVTNARAGHSWHNHRIAFDIGIFNGTGYVPESPLYAKAGRLGESLGLEWGGRWKFQDLPHYQWNPNQVTLADARRMHDQNQLFA